MLGFSLGPSQALGVSYLCHSVPALEVGMLHGDTFEHEDLVPADVRPPASAAHLSRRWRCRSTVVLAGNHMSFRHVLHLQWVVQGPVFNAAMVA